MSSHDSAVTDFNSDEVVESYDIYPLIHFALGRPAFLDFIGDVRGKQVLDLGCGTGQITSELHKRGANCQGIDLSPKFIEIARSRFPDVNYSVGDACALSNIASSTMDVVAMNMVLLGIDSEAVLDNIFRECSRVLKTNGHLLFSHVHPLMMQRLKDGFREVRLSEDWHYFKRGDLFKVTTTLTNGSLMTFTDAHWSLSTLSELLEKNAFVISALREPEISPDNEHFATLKDELQIPYYIFFKAMKANRTSDR